MKRQIFFSVCAVVLLGFTTGKILDEKAKTLLKQFQLTEDNAMNTIFSNISGPTFYIPNAKTFKSLAAGERGAMVETIGSYVKDFTASQDFMNRYNEFRENKKPTPPEKPQSGAELQKQQITEMKNSIAEMEKTKKQMPADQQGMFDDIIKQLEEQLVETQKPDNPMYGADFDNVMKESYQYQIDDYNNRHKEWETNYPPGKPEFLIKKWLETFLEKSKDIDFNAQLVTNAQGKQVFAKSEYERKDYLWKLLFRAGKESVDASRMAAQTWYNELK